MVSVSDNCQLTEYTKKLRQRAALGWDKVHQDLQKTPFCQRREMLVKVMFCLEHENCCLDGICVPCIRKDSINHYASPDIDEYNSPRRCIEICDDDLEHAWILCKLRGLNLAKTLTDNMGAGNHSLIK